MNMENTVGQKKYDLAVFAGGCFWCLVAPFQQLEGVVKVESGYTGGSTENPTYEEVCSGETGHREAVRITYDPEIISFSRLLDTYWRQTDPTDPGGQFADRGSTYQTAIYYHNESQKKEAEASKKELENSKRFNKPIVTQILPAAHFYPAEEYHQDYHKKHPGNYKLYRMGSGRANFIKKNWGQIG